MPVPKYVYDTVKQVGRCFRKVLMKNKIINIGAYEVMTSPDILEQVGTLMLRAKRVPTRVNTQRCTHL